MAGWDTTKDLMKERRAMNNDDDVFEKAAADTVEAVARSQKYLYLIALKPTGMESRSDIIPYLKENGAVHLLSDVWLLKSHYRFAEDIKHEVERWQDFQGRFFAIKLNQPADLARIGLSTEAEAWLSELVQ
jgi:hypothetical protein